MKIIVPRFRHFLTSTDPDILNVSLCQIDERDLKKMIDHWDEGDKTKNKDIRDYYSKSAKDICEYGIEKKVLLPYLRREHITVHCGAKEGADHCRDLYHSTLHEIGGHIARLGYNYWYGGGEKGLMGAGMRGFLDARRECNFPDQYVIQVIPAKFAVKPSGENVINLQGVRKVYNEGLCYDTDVAIVLPDFMTRRDLLGSICKLAVGAAGGMGTLDEITDVATHTKTGLRDTLLRIVDTYVPVLNEGCYEGLRHQIRSNIICGMDDPGILDYFKFFATPAEVFADIEPHPPVGREANPAARAQPPQALLG